jgi:hypothetical protein
LVDRPRSKRYIAQPMARVAYFSRRQISSTSDLKRLASKLLQVTQQSCSIARPRCQVSASVHPLSKPLVFLFSLATLCIVTAIEPVVAQAKPSFLANVTLSPKFAPDPQELRGVGGGAIAAATIAGRAETQTGACNGFVDTKPDHTVVLGAFFDYLSLQVESPQDTTLVIKGPGGVWCNDDHEGKDPGVSGEWLAGTYQVWIGSYDKSKYVPYILKITGAR